MAHPLEVLVQRYGERDEMGGTVMVANVASLRPTWLPLTEHMDLRRATVHEARDFQRLYELYVNTWTHRRNPFATRAMVSTTAQGWHAQRVPLAEHELRHHVVEFRGVNGPVHDLRSASALTDRELHLGMEIHFGRTAGIGATRGVDLEPFLDRCSFDDQAFEDWNVRDAADLADTYPAMRVSPSTANQAAHPEAGRVLRGAAWRGSARNGSARRKPPPVTKHRHARLSERRVQRRDDSAA